MSPFKVVEVSPDDDEITRQINEKAQEIADAQIQRLGAKRTLGRAVFEEVARAAGMAGTLLTIIWFVGEPHLARYIDERLLSMNLAGQPDVDRMQAEINRVSQMTEQDQRNIIALTTRMTAIDDTTKETRSDIKTILQRLPQRLGETVQ
jgi:uncharacterized membrane protein